MSPLALGLQLTAGTVLEIISLDYTTVSANNDRHLHDVRVLISLSLLVMACLHSIASAIANIMGNNQFRRWRLAAVYRFHGHHCS